MKESFEQFFELCRKSTQYDPWARTRGLNGYCNELVAESNEAADAVRNNDAENLKEELGDVLFDWAHVCILAEEKGMFTTKEVIENVKEKLRRRKPFLEENRQVTIEEAKEIWKKVKEYEKQCKQGQIRE